MQVTTKRKHVPMWNTQELLGFCRNLRFKTNNWHFWDLKKVNIVLHDNNEDNYHKIGIIVSYVSLQRGIKKRGKENVKVIIMFMASQGNLRLCSRMCHHNNFFTKILSRIELITKTNLPSFTQVQRWYAISVEYWSFQFDIVSGGGQSNYLYTSGTAARCRHL